MFLLVYLVSSVAGAQVGLRVNSARARLSGTMLPSLLGAAFVVSLTFACVTRANADLISHCAKGGAFERLGDIHKERDTRGYADYRQAAREYAHCAARDAGRAHYVDMVFAAGAAANAAIAAYRTGDPYRDTFPSGNSRYLLRTARNVLNQVLLDSSAPSDVKDSATRGLGLVSQALKDDPTPDSP
jgi:hypothetical protein